MRIRIHADVAKLVDASRKGKRSANSEVNMVLAVYYAAATVNKDEYYAKILKQISRPLPVPVKAFKLPKK